MALTAGTKLGPYEIVSPLGAGGMGEVYRARDTRLERTVAIKILPPHLSEDPMLRQRFEREAKAISRLNHPHICVLHDVGNQDGTAFLVMECVEGETLSKRLEKGPLPLEQVLKYGMQIADALDKAHRSGIVHRDLKPGNIVLTSSGAKLLDFGLAKPVVPLAAGAPATVTPAQMTPVTELGVVVGTFQYMSPEQVEGREVDGRSDIFSLGSLLYEMVTGRPAFMGKSPFSVASAILEKEPEPVSALQPLTPSALDHAIRVCLAKEPEDRWQTARDVFIALRWAAESQASLQPPRQTPRLSPRTWIAAAAVAVLIAATALWVGMRLRATEPPLVGRFSVLPTPGTMFASLQATVASPVIAVSPDGKQLAFVAADVSGRRQLWIRNLDSLTPRSVAGTEGTISAFWSPDSRSLAFFAEGKLKRLDISRGSIQVLCDAANGRGGSWSSEGTIIFARNVGDRLYRISASGGAPVPVTELNRQQDEWSHRYPSFLPDGRHFLYLVRSTQSESNGIFLASLDGGSPRKLSGSEEAVQPDYASGYLLYAQRNGALLAQEFDLKRLRPTGNPRLIAEHIAVSQGYGYGAYSVSANGVLAYSPATVPETRLMWVKRNGQRDGQVGVLGGYASIALSPDSKHVAVDPFDPQLDTRDIVLVDGATGAQRKLTFTTKNEFFPVWSPDGRSLVYAAEGGGGLPDLFMKPASGAAEQQALISGGGAKFPTDWSKDGKYVLYHGGGATTGWDVYVYSTADHTAKPLIQTAANEEQAQFSPDGRWVAYTSDETGNLEVYVRSFSSTGGTWRVSAAGGSQPRWRQDGQELFYVAPDSRLMAVPVHSSDVFEAGTPHALFETSLPLSISPHPTQYAVASDGQRFLVNLPVETITARPLTLVLNWPAELKQ